MFLPFPENGGVSVSMEKIQRISTGLSTLDSLIEGGIPKGTVNLLSGACGTGKTILAMQFLYEGAKKYGEPSVYLSLEENPKDLITNMGILGWDLQELIDKGKLLIVKPEVYSFDSLKRILSDSVDKIHATRLVVDSYSVMLTYFSDSTEIRNGLVALDRHIKKLGCTALIISDIKEGSGTFSTTGVEEFIVDGVIILHLVPHPRQPYESIRTLSIRKMRATLHSLKTYSFDIKKGGVHLTKKCMYWPLTTEVQ